MTGRDLKRKKALRAGKPAKDETTPQVSRGAAGGEEVYKPGNTTCLLSSLERCIPLKATEFKSSEALSENGIK